MARNDTILVLALARGESVHTAAKKSGISASTVFRRRKTEAFRQSVAAARAEMIGRATGQLAATSVRAVQTLRKLLAAQSEAVRRAAAVALLDAVCRWRDSDDFEQRLQRLETVMKARLP